MEAEMKWKEGLLTLGILTQKGVEHRHSRELCGACVWGTTSIPSARVCSVLSAAPMQGNGVSEVGVVLNDGL